MIETWIDHLAAVWEISDTRFGTVKSFKLVQDADFPDSLEASDLDLHPVALTIPGGVQFEYSLGGPRIGFYSGVTEFHVAPDLNRSRLPALLPWYGKIVRAAAAAMQLSGTVEYFVISDQPDAIQGPLALQYGSENPHWGFVVNWTVKEHITLTVSA